MNAQTLRLDGLHRFGMLRQQHPIQNPPRYISKSLQYPSPSSRSQRPEDGAEDVVDQLAKNTREIREKLHTALKRRIGLGKPVSVKVVARATGLTERTIENAMSGETMPRGDTLIALVDFFDATFANEVLGHLGIVITKPKDAAQKALDGLTELSGGDRIAAEVFLAVFQQAQALQRGDK